MRHSSEAAPHFPNRHRDRIEEDHKRIIEAYKRGFDITATGLGQRRHLAHQQDANLEKAAVQRTMYVTNHWKVPL
jgi:hypothetical protein